MNTNIYHRPRLINANLQPFNDLHYKNTSSGTFPATWSYRYSNDSRREWKNTGMPVTWQWNFASLSVTLSQSLPQTQHFPMTFKETTTEVSLTFRRHIGLLPWRLYQQRLVQCKIMAWVRWPWKLHACLASVSGPGTPGLPELTSRDPSFLLELNTPWPLTRTCPPPDPWPLGSKLRYSGILWPDSCGSYRFMFN